MSATRSSSTPSSATDSAPPPQGLRRVEGVSAEKALFEGITDGLVVALPSNEAPLLGLAGILDWRFHGQISQFHSLNPSTEIRTGLKGHLGELTLMPLQHRGRRFQVLFVGVGPITKPGARLSSVLGSLAHPLQTTLNQLGWKSPGFSARDWGDVTLSQLSSALAGRDGLLLD